ncbi:MAG: PepSY domain-containing protein [Selenomonadaceae bacterium]|nr:PepSY domain-containing protein [Selenomonadaceae bacterium]
MDFNEITSKAKKFWSKGMLKKLGAAVLVGTMLAGGACYAHEQRDHAKAEARAAMIRQQAAEKNVVLIDETRAKSVAAKAIGIDESKLTFHSIKLKCGDKHQPTEDFKPIYKVKCYANGIKYEVKLDAVSGNIIDFDC